MTIEEKIIEKIDSLITMWEDSSNEMDGLHTLKTLKKDISEIISHNEPSIDIRSISEKWVGIWQSGENTNLYQCVDEAIKEALKGEPSIQEDAVINALDACFGAMMQPTLTNDRGGYFTVPFDNSLFIEARGQAEKMYYEAKKILKTKPQPLQEEGLEGILLDFLLYLSKRNFTRDYDFEFEKEIKKFLKTNKS